ncbi:MAG: glycoside hydrolase family 2 TIM barrel-domain containing protein [Phocaeicola sp.]
MQTKKWIWALICLPQWLLAQSTIDLSGCWRLSLSSYPEAILPELPGRLVFNDSIVLPSSLDEAQKGSYLPTTQTMRWVRKSPFVGKAWYEKEIHIPLEAAHKPLNLYLERTRPTHLWIDGAYQGNSLLISSPQNYLLKEGLPQGKHTLTLLVDNGKECGLPQTIASSHMWSDDTQTNWNGILGKIELQVKPAVTIERIRFYSDIQNKTLTARLLVTNYLPQEAAISLTMESQLLTPRTRSTAGSYSSSCSATDRDCSTLGLLSSTTDYSSTDNSVTDLNSTTNGGTTNPTVDAMARAAIPATHSWNIPTGTHEIELTESLGADALLWSEFEPNRYETLLTLKQGNRKLEQKRHITALRNFKAQGKHFTINGQSTFLRGKHDACVFPLTGYAPMRVADWLRYFHILKSYGFNHVRFHSWCPPKAAFEAADELGFYLQPELPIWGAIDDDTNAPTNQFLFQEAQGILDSYANHPSFVMFATGNELWGNVTAMQQLTHSFRSYDDRPLYALGSNYHLGWSGENEGEDFMVSCRVGPIEDEKYQPHVRSSFSFADAIDGGLLNATPPNTTLNVERGANFATKPVIAHETGQFQIYPNEKELTKYSGVLAPTNLQQFLERALQKHGRQKVEQFFWASGALSAACYKADVEVSLRTPSLAGFQMLDIQDFPGQGTALIGLLDAFMDDKGLVSAEKFSQYNAPVVPLWVSPSYTWLQEEAIEGTIQLFNYAQYPMNDCEVAWEVVNPATGEVLKEGVVRSAHSAVIDGAESASDKGSTTLDSTKKRVNLNKTKESESDKGSTTLNEGAITVEKSAAEVSKADIGRGVMSLGQLAFTLPELSQSTALQLNLKVVGSRYRNSYPLWVYTQNKTKKLPAAVKLFTEASDKLWSHLEKGGTAWLMPTQGSYPEQSVGGLFTNDYWNYSMFKSISENAKKPISPGTLGYLIEREHPLFSTFPTESHSNWQWWPAAKLANPLILDNLSTPIQPIVEAIDNVERNHRLGVVLECKVGKGKLFISMIDLNQGRKQYKECEQLYQSIVNYLASKAFNPVQTVNAKELKMLFESSYQQQIEGVKNVSY